MNKTRPQTYNIGNQGPGLGQAQKCGGAKPVNGNQPSPSWASIWISYLATIWTFTKDCIKALSTSCRSQPLKILDIKIAII